MWETIAAAVGAITGIVSLVVIGVKLIFGQGETDAFIKELKADREKYPPAEQHRMIQTLWDVYVLDPLHQRTDLSEHHSPARLTQAGLDVLPDDLKKKLDVLATKSCVLEDVVTGYEVVQEFGLETIGKLAEERKVTVQEMVALLSCYLTEKRRDC